MYRHPTITTAVAQQHRRDLLSQASAGRQARAVRQSSPRTPARRPLIVKALRTAAAVAAVAAVAAAAFLVTLAGPGHAPSANAKWTVHFPGHGDRGTVSHSLVLVHHFDGNIRFAHYRVAGRWA
jgi:hypothetical protein